MSKLWMVLAVAVLGGAVACGGDDDESKGGTTTGGNSECQQSSDCQQIVCDCPNGPVNFTGCNVNNGVGKCATAANCKTEFTACN